VTRRVTLPVKTAFLTTLPRGAQEVFDSGEVVTIHYPVSTHVRLFGRVAIKPRQIVVRAVRDLVSEPLTPEEFLRRPFIRRSRWLIRAFEPEHNRFRQFYAGSSLEYAAPCQLRVALYEPGANRPKEILYSAIEPNVRHRKALLRLLQKHLTKPSESMLLRIYSDDLRLHA
jgi:hypothetical protein